MIPVYAAIKKPLQIIGNICSSFKKSVIPIASEIFANNDIQGTHNLIIRGSRLGNALYAPAGCVLILLIEPVFRLWIGEQFTQYAWIAQIACLYQLFFLSKFYLNAASLGMGMIIRFQGIFSIVSALLFTAMNVIMLKHIGVEGAIWAKITVGLSLLPFWFYYMSRKLSFSVIDFFKQVTIKGQFASWMLLCCFFPIIDYFNNIHTWNSLISISIFLLLIFYFASLKYGVEKTMRIQFYNYIKNKYHSLIKAKITPANNIQE